MKRREPLHAVPPAFTFILERPLGEAASRVGLPASLQCRSGNPNRVTRYVKKSKGDGCAHRSHLRPWATTARVRR